MGLTDVSTVLNDGFITCSVFTTKTNELLSDFQLFDSEVPLIVPNDQFKNWLANRVMTDGLNKYLVNSENKELKIHIR